METWGSSDWGQSFTNTVPWRLTLDNRQVDLRAGNSVKSASLLDIENITVTPGIIWAAVEIKIAASRKITLDGIPNARARQMGDAIRAATAATRAEAAKAARLKELLAAFQKNLTVATDWTDVVLTVFRQHERDRRWISEETIQDLIARKPAGSASDLLTESLKHPEIRGHVEKLDDRAKWAAWLWMSDLSDVVAKRNATHVNSELVACKEFFDKVEKSPLTEEQARAVICFDNRLQLIASAGSGKTSTMVAKAGYALHRDLVPADQILLLAFNADAAKELAIRIRERLTPLGLNPEKIVAKTFHSFGLEAIGHATGKKPTLAPWLDGGGDIRRLSEIVDQLKHRDPKFRATWDMFRVVFGRDLPKFGKSADHEDWDANSKETGFRTLHGELVKSQEERIICDWLFYNGVEYQYEKPYQANTATPQHRQYRPDFYYPAANAYHEHFALNAKGEPPEEFVNYMDGVDWKRGIHKATGTTLWETTSASLRSGKGLNHLAKLFKEAKVKLDPNPDRPALGRKVIENIDLVRTIRTFLTHAKSNSISDAMLRAKIKKGASDAFAYRHEMFLALFASIRAEWERRLQEEGVIDFEDMLNQAAEHLENGAWVSPYRLILVDEFQDASRARARMTRALVSKPGQFLCAVGDDWQSINRFAGADLSVMTGFADWFGKSQTLRLERTFRCPQSICNISSQFVLKNPVQIRKAVNSTQKEFQPTVQAFQVKDEHRISGAIRDQLAALAARISKGEVEAGKEGRVSVFVLGRYRRDAEFIDQSSEYGDLLSITFMTIHGSKGLEADYVVLPRLTKGAYGFPSAIEDDPVLQLAMPQGEDFVHAEERRLFYVALTRARRAVLLFTVEHRMSSFITELVQSHKLRINNTDGEVVTAHVCPKCHKGSMVPRNGKHGKFWACNRFPACKSTSNSLKDAEGRIVYP